MNNLSIIHMIHSFISPSILSFIHYSKFLLFSDILPFINLFMNMVDSKQFLQTAILFSPK